MRFQQPSAILVQTPINDLMQCDSNGCSHTDKNTKHPFIHTVNKLHIVFFFFLLNQTDVYLHTYLRAFVLIQDLFTEIIASVSLVCLKAFFCSSLLTGELKKRRSEGVDS